MKENARTKSLNVLPSCPVISGMMVFGVRSYIMKYGAFLTKHLFRRKHARHQVVFESAITTLTAGTVR